MSKYLYICVISLICASTEVSFGYTAESPTLKLYTTTNSTQKELAWSARPKVRYLLQQTTNLQENSWSTIDGFSSKTDALAQQHIIGTENVQNRFFRVQILDEQPPKMIDHSPKNKSIGVDRFSPIRMQFNDRIAPESLSLTVGRNTYSIDSEKLSLSKKNILELNLGADTALGDYGTTQQVNIAIADIHGNATNYTWGFELKEEIVAVSNLFIFGSATAQQAGQQLSGVAATLASQLNNPPQTSSSGEWVIDSVTANTMVINYTGTTAPAFTAGQKIANIAPAHRNEIFYRKITKILNNTTIKQLTLETENLLLEDIMEFGSFSLGNDRVSVLEFADDGTLTRAIEINDESSLPTIGGQFNALPLINTNGTHASLEEGGFTLAPQLNMELKIEENTLKQFQTDLSGDLKITCVPSIESSSPYEGSFTKQLWDKKLWYWTSVETIPIGIELKANLSTQGTIITDTETTLSAGFRQTGTLQVHGVYRSGEPTTIEHDIQLNRFEKVHPDQALGENSKVSIALIVQLDYQLFGTGGISFSTDPYLNIEGSTDSNIQLASYADSHARLSLTGNHSASPPPNFSNYLTEEWSIYRATEPAQNTPLRIAAQPQSKNATYGKNVLFEVQVSGAADQPTYQWFHNETRLPGKNDAQLYLTRVDEDFAGKYTVKIRSGKSTIQSEAASLNILPDPATKELEGMVFIPGGTNSGINPDGAPYSLTVSAFYMDRTEITKDHWMKVYNWAITNNYSFQPGIEGQDFNSELNHPVAFVNWYDCIKWCNARSEMNGLTPHYASDGQVYRSGEPDSIQRIPTANGHRLPTRRKWQYAARGGLKSKRFPWGNIISYSYANYNGGNYDFDRSSEAHPLLGFEGRTIPAGSLSPNGYGLYDMLGNLGEWGWERKNRSRAVRGGNYFMQLPENTLETGDSPDMGMRYIGFRTVRLR